MLVMFYFKKLLHFYVRQLFTTYLFNNEFVCFVNWSKEEVISFILSLKLSILDSIELTSKLHFSEESFIEWTFESISVLTDVDELTELTELLIWLTVSSIEVFIDVKVSFVVWTVLFWRKTVDWF